MFMLLGSLEKKWTPQNVMIANFGHPVSKAWLSPCFVIGESGRMSDTTKTGDVQDK